MRCNRVILSLIVAVSSTLASFAQIKDFVPIVRPVVAEATVAYLEKLAESLSSEGYTEAADALKLYASGGFGSGFVIETPNGKRYVVTNRHVVAQAESVTIEFERPDGSRSVYKACPILAIGESLDLALIGPPPGTEFFGSGLAFSTAAIVDGAEVWSAGYPALGNTPGWQLGKGNVTNSAARIPELVDPALTSLIQHSAQIDSGNSGGPLLVEDKSNRAGFKVIGINTWKAVGRQATNLAIPAKAVRDFVDATVSPSSKAESRGAKLESRCRLFVGACASADSPYKAIREYISYSFVARNGEAILKEVLSTSPTKVRNDVLGVFLDDSPIEGIRLAIAYKIQTLQTSKGAAYLPSFVKIEGDPENGEAPVPVLFSSGGKDLRLS